MRSVTAGASRAAYNFVWCHEGLRLSHEAPGLTWRQRTPAMAAGLTDYPWTMDERLRYQVPPALWVAPPVPSGAAVSLKSLPWRAPHDHAQVG